jgi:hypothetical protein
MTDPKLSAKYNDTEGELDELGALKTDYHEMVSARMFYDEPPPFDQIIQTLEEVVVELESRLSPAPR